MAAKVFAMMAYLIGVGGAASLMGYVLGVGTGLVPRRDWSMDWRLAMTINLGLLTLFALQHSVMSRTWFKAWWTTIVPPSLERSLYVAASGVAALVLLAFWQPLPGEPLWNGPWWIVCVGLASAVITTFGCLSFDHVTFFGLTQAWTGEVQTVKVLKFNGPYRYVRHPQMLGVLLMLWAQPSMPPELFVLNVGLTVYIVIAIRLEERQLIREFGPAYETYRREVPALLPFVW